MNGVEAAASLFGPEEPSSDPFAALGADTAPQPSTNDLFQGDGASGQPDFLSPGDTGLLDAGDNAAPDASHLYTHTEVTTGYSASSSYLGAGSTSQQGWYDEHGHWQNYEQTHAVVQSTLATVAERESYAPQEHHDTSNYVYNPYAPASNAYNPPVNAPTYAQTPYNAYSPAQPTNPYAPSQTVAPATSSYTPYAYTPSSVAQAPASQYAPSYATGHQTGYTPSTTLPPSSVSVPPPATAKPPAATITRPKISNAYDPPFPAMTMSTRRGARAGSGQHSYGYSAYESASSNTGPFGVPLSQPPFQSSPTPPPQRPHSRPPPPQSHPPPPQSHPPPPQSHPPPPARSPVYHHLQRPDSRIHNKQYDSLPAAGLQGSVQSYAQSHGLGVVENLTANGEPQSTLWDSGYADKQGETDGTSVSVDDYGLSQSLDPEALHHDVESSAEDNPYEETPSQGQYYPPSSASPKKTQSHVSSPIVNPYIAAGVAVRTSSPHQTALPPSPTLSQHHGRFSPFVEQNLSGVKRTVSPKSFVEPTWEKTQDLDQHISPPTTSELGRARSPLVSSTTKRNLYATPANGVRSPPVTSVNPYLPKSTIGEERAASPATSLSGQPTALFDPYAPTAYTNGQKADRVGSPSSFSVRSVTAVPPPSKAYPPASYAAPRADSLRNRSMSNSSMLSSASTSLEDPYAPSQQSRRVASEADSEYAPKYNYPNGNYHHPQEAGYNHPSTLSPEYPAQEVSVKTFQTPYAPSPSLLGANDPLGRTSVRVPVFSFGFGGKLVTCFHGAESLSTGFDVALSSRNSTGVQIRVLRTLIPESALDTSTASFPGPLFCDPATPTTSLVRTGATTQTKTKKARVIKYLSERTDELALGLRYLRPESIESRRAEGKLVLVKLLQIMVEHDGRLTGTPELDTAVRVALVPRLEGTFTNGSPVAGFAAVADTQGAAPILPYTALPGFSSESAETPLSVTTLRPSSLDKIQDFLLRGERRKAYHYALDEKLWAHAMVISSSIDKEAWKEVVNEFLKNELGVKEVAPLLSQPNGPLPLPSNGRESLRVAYSLFSGQGAAAVQELVPQNLLALTTNRLQPGLPPHLTPRTPNFAVGAPSANIPPETLSKWAETIAMMLQSPLSQENSVALTSLGDQLAASQLVEAAHVCYLLAPQTSSVGGLGHLSARIVLVGARSPQNWPSFSKDPDALIFSEILEYALSLAPAPKGQEAFSGIAHLQAYRFIRAMTLAEIGDIQQAKRYCEAITTAINRSSPYATPVLLEQLKGLSDRISGVTQVDKSFWTGAKLSKPSLDTIGGWLEGRITQIITGGTEVEKTAEEDVIKPDVHGFSGTFSQYSTISSATPSARSSPVPSVVNVNVLPPARTGSAMSSHSPYAHHPQIDRASSAMDYTKRKPSPGPRIVSANASTTTFSNSPSFGQALNGQRAYNGYSPSEDLVTPRPSLTTNDEEESTVQVASWWGSSAYDEGPATQTPTAASFMRVDESAVAASPDGFISLMDSNSYSVGLQAAPARTGTQLSPRVEEEDEEDLGFGNSKRGKLSAENGESRPAAAPEPAKPADSQQPQTKAAPAAGGWLSRWWKKSDAAPGPIKASLGEESAFYYDKDLKRWVNKKAGGAEASKPAAPPPPPSRPQTASPSMSGPRPPGTSEAGPPPTRSTSAIDLSTSPPSRTVMRVRSNLVPTPESAPSTPTGTRLAPPGPPPGRPKSQASKRNIRNRYVDVFQQEGGAA
ncbi:COPII coat assembly protein sec16 [Hypsizygus marmoreus]|uniref:Protein transport protein sec16 n=1 Tax=Hypsizygus marmoreus TaxID=39966 RepID=A0A369JFV9_HYPMA|nr:COPII coat assembly protein sec16 [Hypsizygus marmoreus]